MDEQSQVEEPGKVIYWLLAIFVIVIMVGLAVFYYVSGQSDRTAGDADTTQTETVATGEGDATVQSSVDELGEEIDAIEEEINSTEDDTTDI